MKPEKQLPLETPSTRNEGQYKGLPEILYAVRWTQHLLAIVAEVLILLSFAASSMDTSLGGIMAGIDWFKWTWAAVFAIGIDTSFVISWVRVRQAAYNRKWACFSWNLLLALGMSFIVFQPVAIQLLQQSLAISFNSALQQLGINIVILVYARAFVAILLGGILALTNIDESTQDTDVSTVQPVKRRVVILDRVLNKIAPIVDTQMDSASVQMNRVSVQMDSVSVHPSLQLDSANVQMDTEHEHTGQQVIAHRVQSKSVQSPRPTELKPVLTPIERFRHALDSEPNASDRRLATLSNLSPTTVGKYRKMCESGQREAV